MKSYGRAPTFLAMTGYEQVRSVTAAIAGDHEAADRVELTLPETGVCGGAGLFDDPGYGRGCRRVLRSGQRTGSGSNRWDGSLSPHDRPGGPALEPVRAPGLDRRGLRRVLVVLCVNRDHQLGCAVLRAACPRPGDRGRHRLVGARGDRGVLGRAGGVCACRSAGRAVVGPNRAAPADDRRVGAGGAGCGRDRPRRVVSGVRGGGSGRGGDGRSPLPAAFAALTRWWGPRRVTALTGLTLLAGLAFTVFAPVSAALLTGLGWRDAYLVLALILALVTIPAHLLGLRGPWPPADHADSAVAGLPPGQVVRSRPFLALVATITAGTFAAFAVVVNQVPLFLERGLSTSTAAWALGLGGVGQVTGRLFYRSLSTRLGVRARTIVVLTMAAAGTTLLAILPGPAVLLIVAAMLTGAARGVFTLLQATAVTDRWGASHYGRLSGILSAPAPTRHRPRPLGRFRLSRCPRRLSGALRAAGRGCRVRSVARDRQRPQDRPASLRRRRQRGFVSPDRRTDVVLVATSPRRRIR